MEIDMMIDKLVNAMNELERLMDNHDPELYTVDYFGKKTLNYQHPAVEAVVECVTETVIQEDGELNWDAIKELSKRGYEVGPGEHDSFGLLSAYIAKSPAKYRRRVYFG